MRWFKIVVAVFHATRDRTHKMWLVNYRHPSTVKQQKKSRVLDFRSRREWVKVLIEFNTWALVAQISEPRLNYNWTAAPFAVRYFLWHRIQLDHLLTHSTWHEIH